MARPRDPDLDRRIIDTVRTIAGRDGPSAVTISAVAEESGVSRPAIYRRWANRAALMFEAQTSRSVDGGFPDLGDVRTELVDAMVRLVDSMADGDRELTGSMLGEMIRSEHFAGEVWANRWGPDTDDMYDVWSRAVERGDVRSDVDGMKVMDDLVATCIYQVMLLHRSFDRDAVEAHVDRLLQGVGE